MALRAGASAQVAGDMSRETWEAALDELAERVFGGPVGARRAAPLLARFDAAVGVYTGQDQGHELLQAARVDWALCDAEIAGAGPGETWALRAALGQVPGVEPSPRIWALATTQVGLFEVWPGSPLMLRDRLGGLVVRVREPTPGLFAGREPAALWEVRVALRPEGACLCRAPIEYPLEILPDLRRTHEQHWRAPERASDLLQLRGLRLRWARTPRRAAPGRFRWWWPWGRRS